MSNKDVDESFWDRADSFIAKANEFSDQVPAGKVSSSLLYAAARFNSFIISSSSDSVEEMEQDKDAALEYFVGQFRKMLEENLDDHIKNFSTYNETKNS